MSSVSSTNTVLTLPSRRQHSSEIAPAAKTNLNSIPLQNLDGKKGRGGGGGGGNGFGGGDDEINIAVSQYEPGPEHEYGDGLGPGSARDQPGQYIRRRRTSGASSRHAFEPTSAMYNSENNPENFPDGGKEANLVLLGSFLGLIADFGIPNTLGAIESYVSSNQLRDIAKADVGWVFSLYLCIMYLGGLLFGELFDKFGAKKPLMVGTLLMCTGLILTGESTELYHFILSFSVLTALGTSIAMSPLIGCLSHWYLRKRALACSVATIGGLVGASCFAIMLQRLYETIGYKNALRVLSCICFACMACSIVLVKERKQTKEATSGTESGSGSSAEASDKQHKETRLAKLLKFLKGALDVKIWTEKKFICLTLAVFLAEVVSMTTLTYLGSYALAFGVDQTSSYLLLTIINLCGIPSRLMSGVVADKYGRFNVMIGTSILTTIFVFALWYPAKHVTLLYSFGVLFGISTSAVLALIPACAGQICSSESFGKIYGNVYFFLGWLTLLGMYFASLVIGDGSRRSYSNFVLFEGALSVASVIMWLLARSSAVGWKWSKF